MDPNATLEEMREIAVDVLGNGNDIDVEDFVMLAELVISLDAWLSNHGSLPDRWAVGRKELHGPRRNAG